MILLIHRTTGLFFLRVRPRVATPVAVRAAMFLEV